MFSLSQSYWSLTQLRAALLIDWWGMKKFNKFNQMRTKDKQTKLRNEGTEEKVFLRVFCVSPSLFFSMIKRYMGSAWQGKNQFFSHTIRRWRLKERKIRNMLNIFFVFVAVDVVAKTKRDFPVFLPPLLKLLLFWRSSV